ncbi:MAG: MBOAT family O-acyltransferase, partial [Acutalibacteraceae bacterium]
FLPVVYILYLLVPGLKAKNILLIIASLFFYAWGEGLYVLLMLVSVFVNWLLGIAINKFYDKKKILTSLAVILNIGMLFWFKYSVFFCTSFSKITGVPIPEFSVHLPIGISFYTFQILSYVIDVSRNKDTVQKNFFNLLLYISLFPQLIAGPIVKYHDIMAQLSDRKITVDAVSCGIRRFLIGLSKKVILADTLAKSVDTIFALTGSELTFLTAWIGAVFYTLEIYFDFSGYSDMAIGLGKMFGFDFKENFNYPYISKSIKEFWNRWHISLSTWFKEYLYIPLGGNRKGKVRTCINLFIVFLVTGLWHGAQFTFLLWGIYNGILIILERIGVIPVNKIKSNVVKHIYTLLAVVIGFVIFRADSVMQAFEYLKAMFTLSDLASGFGDALIYLTPFVIFIFAISVAASLPVIPSVKSALGKNGSAVCNAVKASGYIASVLLFAVCFLIMASDSYSPFIYFRF